MAILTLQPGNKSIEVAQDANLLESIHEAGYPIGKSCGAVAVCAKCRVRVIEGMENLTPLSRGEKKLIERDKIPTGERISCLVKIKGPVTVTTSYW